MKEQVAWVFNPKNQRTVLLILLLLLTTGFGVAVNKINKQNVQAQIAKQNITALQDTLRKTETKLGEVEYAKSVLIAEKGNLETLNEDLATELKKEKGRVYELNNIVASIGESSTDTIVINNTIVEYPDSTYGLPFEYDTIYDTKNCRYIKGESKFRFNKGIIEPLTTTISKDIIKFNLVTGLREKDDKLEIFARSNYPGFEIVELEGAIIDPTKHPVIKKFTKPKRWGVGPYIGAGLGVNTTPNPNVGLGISFGVGVQYSLIRF